MSCGSNERAERKAFLQIPIYIWAPEEEGQFQPGRCSRWWLHQSLGGFEVDLHALGSRLVYRRGKESRTTLLELIKETEANAVVFNHLYDPISLVRDNEVKAAMQEVQVSSRQGTCCSRVLFCQSKSWKGIAGTEG